MLKMKLMTLLWKVIIFMIEVHDKNLVLGLLLIQEQMAVNRMNYRIFNGGF